MLLFAAQEVKFFSLKINDTKIDFKTYFMSFSNFFDKSLFKFKL